MSTDGSDQLSPPSNAPGRRGKSRRPGKWVAIVLVVIVLLGAIVQGTEVLGDHGLANIATCVLALVSVTTLTVWFLRWSGYGWRLRLLVLAGCVVGVLILAVLFRVERFSGEMMPFFAYRFSAEPDWLLPPPQPDVSAGDAKVRVDLHATGENDFPQFLGPHRSAAVEHVRLARNWAEQPPKLLWRHKIGAGWSAFSAVDGHAVTMEQRGNSELVTCYVVKTGRLEWAYATTTRYENLQGGVGPRATPTIDDGRVYALGALGHLVCLDGATGKPIWEKDLLQGAGITPEEEAAAIPWGRSASPLLVGDRVIVPLGGHQGGKMVSLAAYDKRRGTRIWEGGKRQISYSSPALATLAGVEQVLIVGEDAASGHDLKDGKLLWEHPWPGRTNAMPNVCQAVPIAPNQVFLSKGYGLGATLVQLDRAADATLAAHTVWASRKVMKTKISNVTVQDGYVYGLSDGILECIELATGLSQWKEGRYGHGQLLRVRDLLLVLTEKGEVVLIEATPAHPNNVLGRFQALEGLTWNNIALDGPYLLVRNAEEAACYKLPLEVKP